MYPRTPAPGRRRAPLARAVGVLAAGALALTLAACSGGGSTAGATSGTQATSGPVTLQF